MRIVLAAINAKFIHSSLAIRSLKKYTDNQLGSGVEICLAEYTINHQTDRILEDIFKKNPDIICFSCYLWNIAMVCSLSRNLKKIMPHLKIFAGGPEVSYDAETFLQSQPAIDLVMIGEGEATFCDVVKALLSGSDILGLPGTAAWDRGSIVKGADRLPMCLDDIPFVYDSVEDFTHRICYYETQRGCPYSCQYCLSSIEKGVRFLSMQRVRQDLQFFLDNNVRQVKFVDRTFNASKAHAIDIWKYLISHDNAYTNFHMEITADLLDADCIALLSQARPGLFQFEIGVQTTNEQTMEAIQRRVDFPKLSNAVKKISALGNIHQHLDLIAGLPHEDYASFSKSFNDVYSLYPEQLQLGFLKLLKGAGLRKNAGHFGIIYREEPVYEVLSTPSLPYEDILRLKRVEELVETYYNSGKTPRSIQYGISLFETPFAFFEAFGAYWEEMGHFQMLHNKMELYTIFYRFAVQHPLLSDYHKAIRDTLKFDMYLNDNIKTLPDWLIEQPWENDSRWAFYNKGEEILRVSASLSGRTAKQLSKTCNIVFFEYAVDTDMRTANTAVLFDYTVRDKFFGHCAHHTVPLKLCRKEKL